MTETPADPLLLIAETVGELKARLDRAEVRFSAQQAPLIAARKVLEASTQALVTATQGIKAVNGHHAALDARKTKRRRK